MVTDNLSMWQTLGQILRVDRFCVYEPTGSDGGGYFWFRRRLYLVWVHQKYVVACTTWRRVNFEASILFTYFSTSWWVQSLKVLFDFFPRLKEYYIIISSRKCRTPVQHPNASVKILINDIIISYHQMFVLLTPSLFESY